MEIIGGMKFYTFDEVKDKIIGPKGTPERDAYEQRLQEELADMKTYTLEEALDEHFGKVGTPRRDAHERQVQRALEEYRKRQPSTDAKEEDGPR
jgi:hypothetical protein